jgi:hypothetical protein
MLSLAFRADPDPLDEAVNAALLVRVKETCPVVARRHVQRTRRRPGRRGTHFVPDREQTPYRPDPSVTPLGSGSAWTCIGLYADALELASREDRRMDHGALSIACFASGLTR